MINPFDGDFAGIEDIVPQGSPVRILPSPFFSDHFPELIGVLGIVESFDEDITPGEPLRYFVYVPTDGDTMFCLEHAIDFEVVE
jgi:hypothetical protein